MRGVPTTAMRSGGASVTCGLAEPTAQEHGEVGAFQLQLDASGGDGGQRLRGAIDDDALQIELEPVEHGRIGASDAPADEADALEAAAVEARARDANVVRLGRTDDAQQRVAQRRLGARVEVGRARRRRQDGSDGEAAGKDGRHGHETANAEKRERCRWGRRRAAATPPL